MSTAIQVNNLSKYYQVHQKEGGIKGSLRALVDRKYQEVKAVDDISFTIDEGELVGFIGPNGAGKTTTMKVLSGILYPTSGEVSVLGFTPTNRDDEYLRQIGLVMGQKNQLWWDLPAQETFLLNKEIYGLSDSEYEDALNEMVELLEAHDLLKVQVRKLSLGQRMKCELIAALLHRPRVLFLDEPTIGLDVVMQKKMRDFIKEYNQRYNATILLTSHYMGDVQELAKRVIMIDEGKIGFDGPLSKITQEYVTHQHVVLTLEEQVDKQALQEYGKVLDFQFPRAELEILREEVPQKVSSMLQNLEIVDLSIAEQPIEEIIRQVFEAKNSNRNERL